MFFTVLVLKSSEPKANQTVCADTFRHFLLFILGLLDAFSGQFKCIQYLPTCFFLDRAKMASFGWVH